MVVTDCVGGGLSSESPASCVCYTVRHVQVHRHGGILLLVKQLGVRTSLLDLGLGGGDSLRCLPVLITM